MRVRVRVTQLCVSSVRLLQVISRSAQRQMSIHVHDSSSEDVPVVTVSSMASSVQQTVPMIDLAADDTPRSRPSISSVNTPTPIELELLRARAIEAQRAQEAARLAQEAAAAEVRYLEAQALSTRSMVPSVMASPARTENSEQTAATSRPTSSQHEADMARLLEIHGHPLHEPVLPVHLGNPASVWPDLVIPPRPAQPARATRDVRDDGPSGIEKKDDHGEVDGRDREIAELMARIQELEKGKMSTPLATSHHTMTPIEAAPVVKDDLGDIFMDPFATNVSAHLVTPTELFATPRESVDLIDLSTPPRERQAEPAKDLGAIQTSPGYRVVIEELKEEIQTLRARIPDAPAWSTVEPPPGLPSSSRDGAGQLERPDLRQHQEPAHGGRVRRRGDDPYEPEWVEEIPWEDHESSDSESDDGWRRTDGYERERDQDGGEETDHDEGHSHHDDLDLEHLPDQAPSNVHDREHPGGGHPQTDPLLELQKVMIEMLNKETAGSQARHHEPATLQFNQLPDIANFETWKGSVRDVVVGAAGGSYEAYLWILEVEDPVMGYERLGDPGNFKSLDAKIAGAISKVQRGTIAKELTALKTQAAKEKKQVSGRQQLWHVYKDYQLNAEHGEKFELEDLMQIEYPGDARLEDFILLWESTLIRMEEPPSESIKRSIFHGCIKGSEKLKEELSRYKMARRDSFEHSYQFLYDAAKQHVFHEKTARNREALVRARNKAAQGGKPTMPVQEHDPENLETKPEKPAKAMPAGGGKGIRKCYDHMIGQCQRDNCPYAHVGQAGMGKAEAEKERESLAKWRATQPCNAFAKGKCKYGEKCQFSHSGGQRSSATPAGACVTTDHEDDLYFQDLDEEQFVSLDCGEVHDDDGDEVNLQAAGACPDLEEKVFIVDSGSENHLINWSSIDPEDPGIHKTPKVMRLQTANGIISADKRVNIDIPSLGVTVDPILLDSTCDVVSMGRLVMEKGFTYHWQPGEQPYFKNKDGQVIECSVRGYVPVIPGDGDIHLTAPGIEAGEHPGDAEAEESEEQRMTRDERLKAEASSPEHCLRHDKKNPYCWVCGTVKMFKKPARRVGPAERSVDPTAFGQHVCGDHVTGLDADEDTVNGYAVGFFILDLYTRWPLLAPTKSKSGEEAVRAMRYYLGGTPLETFYSDCAMELKTVGEELANIHDTSTPYRPESNSICERGIRTMLEGCRAALIQAGLPERFWPIACAHQCFATAISNQRDGGPSPYWLRHGEDFGGWRLPLGSLVHYRPPRPVLKGLHKMAPRSIPGVFVGWHVEPGCTWGGDYLVIPLAAFKSPGRKMYNSHRIKELVSFDPMDFPLQAALIEDRHGVKATKKAGGEIWPDQVEPETEEDDKAEKSATLDSHYEELFGKKAPDGMSFEEKYLEVAMKIFGSEGHEDEGSAGSGESRRPEADDEVPTHGAGSTRRAYRTRRITLPKNTSRAMAAVEVKERGPERHDPAADVDRAYAAMTNEARAIDSPVPRRKVSTPSDRRLVEYCCGPDSLLGRPSKAQSGCAVVRLTVDNDLTTESGLKCAMDAVESAPAGQYVHLWASMPCTAGSPWQAMNLHRHPGAQEKIDKDIKIHESLMDNFIKVADAVKARDGDVSIEWPTRCTLWKREKTLWVIERFGLSKIDFFGCGAGLRSAKTGKPVKKPWTVATSSRAMMAALGKFRCCGEEEHEPCAGQETKRTENYTPRMAAAVHHAIREQALSTRARVALSVVETGVEEYDDAFESLEQMPDPQGHREKVGNRGLWCSMVTKTLHPSDPMRNHPGAKMAIENELADLRSYPVWDEENPIEAKQLAVDQPDAHIARIFPIVGVKHWEDPTQHLWKARVVFEGSFVKTATGQWALFHDLGAVPSTMSACRAALAAYCLIPGAKLYQSDCVKAYIQALMRGTPTYVRLPKAWWPSHWVGRFQDPVCRLLRALYGHPDAGNNWADKISAELKRLEFVEVEGWNAVYIKHYSKDHVIIFVLYVDDLVICGSGRVEEIVKEVRKNIRMDEPAAMQKYLGVIHHITSREVSGERITEICFDMAAYFRSAIEDYLQISGAKLTRAASPYAPKVESDELDRLLETPGKLEKHAAHLVMKLMYGARMALPYLCIVVGRLSSQITRWTADSDRRLHRVYCYLQDALEVKLTGTLSTADLHSFKIGAWPDADFNGDVHTTKSTSGYWLEVMGDQGRRFPLCWGARRQGCTTQCTAEAETVSLSACVKNAAIPMQHLLESIFQREIMCEVYEDNSACIAAIKRGYSPSLKHLMRTQRVSLGFLHEIFFEDEWDFDEEKKSPKMTLMKADTAVHRGDMFTKEVDPQRFAACLDLIGMRKQGSEASPSSA